MSQKEQILQVLSRALSTFGSLSTLTQNTTAQYIIKEQIRDLNKAIAHVKETPKTEHVEFDRLKKSGNVDVMREALRQNVRAFRDVTTGEIKYLLTENDSDLLYEDVMIIPNLTNEMIDQALAAEPAPLVRLTEEDQLKIVNFFLNCGLDNWQKLWQCSNAIMDVMEQKNRGVE